jgi:hypothetical protein
MGCNNITHALKVLLQSSGIVSVMLLVMYEKPKSRGMSAINAVLRIQDDR